MAITANQSVLTLDYWKSARHLEVGDWVFDMTGTPVQVKLVQQYYADECYEVLLDDNLTVSGDKLLAFRAENEEYRKGIEVYKGVRPFVRPLKFVTVEKLLEVGLQGRGKRREYSIPTTKPLQFPAQTPGIPPFVFGFWFFNRKANKTFSILPAHINFVEKKFKDAGYKIQKLSLQRRYYQFFYEEPNIERQLLPVIPVKIPANYLLASQEERIELLSGLINGKPRQYNPKTDWFRLTFTNLSIIQQIQGLAESLGCKTRIRVDDHRKNYVLSFRCKHKLVPNQVSKPAKVHLARRYIKEIRQIEPQMVVHIETEGKNNTILVAEGFISVC